MSSGIVVSLWPALLRSSPWSRANQEDALNRPNVTGSSSASVHASDGWWAAAG